MAPMLPAVPAHRLTFTALGRVQSQAQYLGLAAFEVRRGERSSLYDVVERKALDAVVVVPYFLDQGRAMVRLRTVVRPPLALRPPPPEGVPAPEVVAWELPAGLIEPGEAPAEAGARELFEELGVRAERLFPLGPPLCPCPAVVAEIHVFYGAELAQPTAGAAEPVPEGDGSLFEDDAAFATLSLDDALLACRQGEIWDAKTELGLRRLADHLRV